MLLRSEKLLTCVFPCAHCAGCVLLSAVLIAGGFSAVINARSVFLLYLTFSLSGSAFPDIIMQYVALSS